MQDMSTLGVCLPVDLRLTSRLIQRGSVAHTSVTVPTSICGDARGEFMGPLALSEVPSAEAPVRMWAGSACLRAGQPGCARLGSACGSGSGGSCGHQPEVTRLGHAIRSDLLRGPRPAQWQYQESRMAQSCQHDARALTRTGRLRALRSELEAQWVFMLMHPGPTEGTCH